MWGSTSPIVCRSKHCGSPLCPRRHSAIWRHAPVEAVAPANWSCCFPFLSLHLMYPDIGSIESRLEPQGPRADGACVFIFRCDGFRSEARHAGRASARIQVAAECIPSSVAGDTIRAIIFKLRVYSWDSLKSFRTSKGRGTANGPFSSRNHFGSFVRRRLLRVWSVWRTWPRQRSRADLGHSRHCVVCSSRLTTST